MATLTTTTHKIDINGSAADFVDEWKAARKTERLANVTVGTDQRTVYINPHHVVSVRD